MNSAFVTGRKDNSVTKEAGSCAAKPPGEVKASEARLLYIDNIRWLMIVLVISMHAADTYSPFGNWYFLDRHPMSDTTKLTFGAWQMYLQCFFMGLLFFVAGYFIPASLERKGTQRFLRDRGVRLGVPVLLYTFFIGPYTEYFVAHSWNSTQPTSFAHEWIKHICNGQFLQENGPLWFCLALLIFSTVYALARAVGVRPEDATPERAAPSTRQVVFFALAMAAGSFAVRAAGAPSIMNMHLGDFSQYVLFFAGGIATAHNHWLGKFSVKAGIAWTAVVLPAGLALWLNMMLRGGGLRTSGGTFYHGWHWQVAAFSTWEAFTGVALSLGMLMLFREKLNVQGRLAQFLSANAFCVYVFHPPIVIMIARLLTIYPWHPLIKFILLTATSATASFVLSSVVFRRIPLLRRAL
jgi:surface polysaccharide O-acyltransferase-like enzyme